MPASCGDKAGRIDVPVEATNLLIDDLDYFDNEYANEERMLARKAKGAATRETAPPSSLLEEETSGPDIAMTYQPARFERAWLGSSLRPFYDQSLITDVLSSVKGGKEASVYCCKAHPNTGHELLAAKVYRPRAFRNLRNDKMYREGRPVLTEDGRAVKPTDQRLMRALGKKTDFGVQVEHTSWLQYEYTTLAKLHAAGAAVPQPIGAAENAVLMSYEGSPEHPAPTLIEVGLDPEEGAALYDEVMRNIRLMLSLGLIHGDLSAYNILYWEGRVTLIDFPQVTSCATNTRAEFILARDITRVCDYFSRLGVECDPTKLARRMWKEFGPREAPMPPPDLNG
jgi:RIO kinase 1